MESMHEITEMSAQLGLYIKHVDIVSEFLHELYSGEKNLYALPSSNFDGITIREGDISHIFRNIYGKKDSPKTYTCAIRHQVAQCGHTMQNKAIIYTHSSQKCRF